MLLTSMHELWSSASYAPHLLSLLFAFAPAAMLIVIAYLVVMRGEPRLRGWLLAHCLSLLPYAITMTMSPSIISERAAETWFRVGAAFIPMAAATGTGFQVALVGKLGPYRVIVWAGVALALAWIAAGVFTDAAVAGVRYLPLRLWYANAGDWAWLALLTTCATSLPGFLLLGRAALRDPPSDARRQLRFVLLANAVTYGGLVDVAFAYGHGMFPIGWLLSGFGSLLVVRALVVEDLLRVRAVDTSAPRLVLLFAAGVVVAWLALSALGGSGASVAWWGTTATLVLSFAGVRVTLAVIALVNQGARGEGPLDRLLAQLVGRARALATEAEVAKLALDIVELGLGMRAELLLAAAEDWGWTTATGDRLADERAPDPLITSWLVEQRGALFKHELAARAPADLRDMLAALFAAHRARALVPVTSHDELLGVMIVPASAARVRGRALEFLDRTADRLAEAIVHARMAQQAARGAALAREVELAATVQRELLPGRAPQQVGEVTIVGSWQPATRCAGDFWGVYPLGGGRVLVAIGDVTGHGVASAMVTAAAVGACDVAVRRSGPDLDLATLMIALDAAVKRVGGGTLSMSAAASILDPAAGEIRFASCGHSAPYLCRARAPGDSGEGEVELQALVARGNLLGSGAAPTAKVVTRPLQAGDLVIWYTDGVIEATDPKGEEYGDRRLQRLLRKLDRAHLAPVAVHDRVHAAVTAHRAGRVRADDETLVIAQLGAPSRSAT